MGILERFPKVRSVLPETYRELYADHYRRNRAGASPASAMAKRMESWMHPRSLIHVKSVQFEERRGLTAPHGCSALRFPVTTKPDQ
jgi:hypothetical protein